MGFHDTHFRTITCNGPNCTKKSVTFQVDERDQSHAKKAYDENPWLNNIRVVQANGVAFVYCEDSCELEAIAAGQHNKAEKKSILLPDGSNAVAVAAAEAQRAEQATRALKAGPIV